MKQIVFLISLLLIIHFSVDAQTEKGSFLIGGSGRAFYTSNPKTKYESYNLTFYPQAGYFLFKNFAFGIKPTITYNQFHSYNYILQRSTTFGISPFIRYYIGSYKMRLFFQGSLGYNHTHNHIKAFTLPPLDPAFANSNDNSFTQDIGAGLVYFINEHVGLEGLINYNHNSYEYGAVSSEFQTSNISFNLGLQIYLPGKVRVKEAGI
jgi:hypothetical protein